MKGLAKVGKEFEFVQGDPMTNTTIDKVGAPKDTFTSPHKAAPLPTSMDIDLEDDKSDDLLILIRDDGIKTPTKKMPSEAAWVGHLDNSKPAISKGDPLQSQLSVTVGSTLHLIPKSINDGWIFGKYGCFPLNDVALLGEDENKSASHDQSTKSRSNKGTKRCSKKATKSGSNLAAKDANGMVMFQLFVALLCACFSNYCQARAENACSVVQQEVDPALKEMTYDIGYGAQKTLVYIEPDVKTFYQGNPPASKKVVPKFTGLATKFINMSNKQVELFWESYEGGKLESMGQMGPFSATGSASHEGHIFVFGIPDGNGGQKILHRSYIRAVPENTYYYDPYWVEGDPDATEKNLQRELNEKERKAYDQWRDTLKFGKVYYNFTGRSYLANYLRDPPRHNMWRADHFGQEHWVITKETHFTEMPPEQELEEIDVTANRRIAAGDLNLHEYRHPEQQLLNLTLRVLSVAPRVFEIPNFLSQVEVDHILHKAAGVTLSRSSVGDIGKGKDVVLQEGSIADTRTSQNAWLPRRTSPIIDTIYRRAADLLRIDEALLRKRSEDEVPEWPHKESLAESLQLVHYEKSQQYTPHHDFGFSDLDDTSDDVDETKSEFSQGTRFATLLLYLNSEGLEGGETTFPRWVNAETFTELRVKPEEGKAVLFYSQLPDGNLDDWSQHAGSSPRKGEKWLANLWIWDPVYG